MKWIVGFVFALCQLEAFTIEFKTIPIDTFLNFCDIYDMRPIRFTTGGLRSHGHFFLWHLLRQIRPDVVIESSFDSGLSTWIIDEAAPFAQIFVVGGFNGRSFWSPRAVYLRDDFSVISLDRFQNRTMVAFFDDHYNAFERVLEAHRKGIKHLIFNCNYPPGYGDCVNPWLTLWQCYALPLFYNQALILKGIVKRYCILPLIVGTCAGNFCPWMSPFVNIPAIWPNLDAVDFRYRERLSIFYNDCIWYRWLTYVELY